jgi:xylulose-5-phosphate/fructose-6-phosphate phosphoketolase
MYRDKDFYFFSPDETTSNRLATVYDASERAWVRQTEAWDQHLAPNGRVIELLSENTLFAVLAGHILSGGTGCMTSYEAFLPIVSSQLDQHLKFLKQSGEIEWRKDVAALNILSTSCWQRQDHNGYTHQNPALISSLLAKPSNRANCLFPVDDVAAAACWEFMQDSKNVVNLTTFNKNLQPRWIDINHARYQLGAGQGCSVFQFASDDNPEVIIAAVGDIPTNEAMEAIKLAKAVEPDLRVRFVGIAALSYAAIGTTTNKLTPEAFNEAFTTDKPIVVNFHGYPETIRAIFSHYADPIRVSAHGYEDQGSTTSPLDELARNQCSRYDLAIDILERAGYHGHTDDFAKQIAENAQCAHLTGLDKV